MTFGKSLGDWNLCINRSDGNHFTRNMTGNRKRLREDESCDFMPLSKRINNLHINNNLVNGSNMPNRNNEPRPENGMPSPESIAVAINHPTYDPGVSSSQSTYYYDNKLLFELHLQRIQRTGQQFPF